MYKGGFNLPIRILHVLNSLNRGGAESMLMNYYRKIDRNNYQFDFVVHSLNPGAFANEVQELGGRIFYVPKFKGYNLFSCLMAWNKIFKDHPEDQIIQGHMPSTVGLYLGWAHLHGRYTIAHAHNIDKFTEELLLKQCIRKVIYKLTRHVADYFFGCARLAGEYRYGEKICNSDRFSVWYNAIDYKKFKYQDIWRNEIRRKWGIPLDAKVIGHVGRFSYQKNHDALLEIFDKYQQIDSNTYLLLVGMGERLDEIKSKVQKYDWKDRVRFSGPVCDVQKYLSAMDVFVFPSFYEGLPVTCIEAQVSGLPLVISDLITKEVDISGKIEFLPINKIEEWPKIIQKKINHGRNYMPNNENYDINKAVKRAEQFYCQINKKVNFK